MGSWTQSVTCLTVAWFVSIGVSLAAEPVASDATTPQSAVNSPLTPEESLKHFQIDPDCRIELVVAEPDVSAPVSIAFDEKGQLWVVEMHDYPNGPAPGEPGKSRIRVLTDEDGDGKYSNPTVFVDQLLFANSLMHWDGGVLVTTDGKLIYFKDTDHDGKADLREVWFEGFATENPQLRCNHPTFGPDNWIYVANGLRNGKVKAVRPKWPQPAPESAKLGEPVDIAGRDFRFNPFTGECEAVSGYGQFGLTFDDGGDRYVCSNRNPCMKIIIEERHLKLNPNLAVPSVYEDVSPAGEKSKLYPISRAWTTSNLHAGQFSAACGLIIYRGTALPEDLYGENFTCDPTGNLIHCDYRTRAAYRTLFLGGRALSKEETAQLQREFLASDETWFRPVNTAMGPDGAMYVVDMYRAVIEHPEYMPTELKTRPDLSLGAERGRIWRIQAKVTRPGRVTPTRLPLSTDPLKLAQLVNHQNGWHRDMAHRLLIERQGVSAEAVLRSIAEDVNSLSESRIVAMRILHGLHRLKSSDLAGAIQREILDKPVPLEQQSGLRVIGQASGFIREAIKLSEYYVKSDPNLVSKLFQLGAREESYNVRNELHLTIGQLGDEFRSERIQLCLNRNGFQDETDAYCIALGERPVLTDVVIKMFEPTDIGTNKGLSNSAWDELPERVLLRAATRCAEPSALPQILDVVLKTRGFPDFVAFAEVAQARGVQVSSLATEEAAQVRYREFLIKAVETCGSNNVPYPALMNILPVLRYADGNSAADAMTRFLRAEQHPPDVVLAILRVAASFPDPAGMDMLLDDFSLKTPTQRSAVIDGLLTSEPRITKLLDLVESNQISFLEIGQTRLTSLQQVKNPEIQARLQKLITANAPADRSKVLEEYQSALTHEHDPLRGRELFAKNCAQCHKIGDLGVDVAPNISDSRVKTQAQLLVDILDPNRAIDNNYFSYTLVDTAGTVATGIVSSETSSSVTMKQPEGKTITVLRSEIDQLKPNGVSLMPVGFEKQLTVAQMADVISFIKNWRYLDGQVPKEVIK